MNVKESSVWIYRLPILAGVLLGMGFQYWLLHYWYGIDERWALWDATLSMVLLGVAYILLSDIINSYIPRAGKFQFTIVLSLVLASLIYWIVVETLRKMGDADASYLAFLKNSQPVRWVIYFLIVLSDGIVNIFYVQGKELRENREHETNTALLAREAELQKLQLQLHPHFLFNSLNSINALILSKPDQAREMVQQLSDFLRVTLKRADEQFVSFRQEWEYLQLYLAIEKVRFGHRLDLNVQLDETCNDILIPTLVLQPLLENAIKFGLYGTVEKVTIGLSARVSGNLLEIEISNPFDADTQPSKGSGFGLSGLQRRLYLIYARNDLMTTLEQDHRFTVTLKIPTQK